MSSKKLKVDYLVVGLGIAGLCLSYQLIKKNKKILVYDVKSANSSSRVAAGIYNPITGRRMVKTWKADLVFPYLERFYQELEDLIGVKVLNPLGIYYPFKSPREQNEWDLRMGRDEGGLFDGPVFREPQYSKFKLDPHGGTVIPLSGFVDLPRLIDGFRAFLSSRDLLREERLNPNELSLGPGEVSYHGVSAKKIFFCDGMQCTQSNFFGWLPFQPVKGEILTIQSDVGFDRIINRGVFILPQGDQKYKVGATYDWGDTSYKITDSARRELIQKLDQLLEFGYKVVDQVAGIRPATRDRRPFIGIHPEFEQIGIFNGLGTKGVSLAPYFSEQFSDSLILGSELDPEANISRCFSLYSRH